MAVIVGGDGPTPRIPGAAARGAARAGRAMSLRGIAAARAATYGTRQVTPAQQSASIQAQQQAAQQAINSSRSSTPVSPGKAAAQQAAQQQQARQAINNANTRVRQSRGSTPVARPMGPGRTVVSGGG